MMRGLEIEIRYLHDNGAISIAAHGYDIKKDCTQMQNYGQRATGHLCSQLFSSSTTTTVVMIPRFILSGGLVKRGEES